MKLQYSLWTPLRLWYFCCKLISMHLWNWQNFLLFAAHTTRHLWLATDVICNCFQLTRVRLLFPWNRTESQILFYLSIYLAIKYHAAIWRLRKLSEISDYVELEPPSGNHYQLHCIRWTKTTSKDIVETKTWTIQYKIQWHNVLFQRSSFTMAMTTSARGLKQSQCDRSFSKT